MRGSDFAELKAFAAVVERASFARAAEHLGLSASALSQTIRHLETRLGARLLNRTTRSVAPTSAGGRLYGRIMPMIQEMDAAVAEAVEATGRTAGTLRINTLGMAAQKLIAPRLGRFHRAYPQVVLDILVDEGLTDIVAGRFDAGIRVGERLRQAWRQGGSLMSRAYSTRHKSDRCGSCLRRHHSIDILSAISAILAAVDSVDLLI